MAKPVWILLPHLADWRWMQQTESTPWYPFACLYRQSASGDWAGVLDRVSQNLTQFYANNRMIMNDLTTNHRQTAITNPA
jgi:hypothetical protein